MRKVVYGINLTADGCCDHLKGIPNEDVHIYFTDLFRDVDLIVYGRKTYELMVPFWPQIAKSRSGTATMNAFARAFDAIDKIVFSTTLQQAEGNTRIVRGQLAEEITRLKQQPGKNISIGGVDLPSQLIALGLVDEFHFVIHPVIAGEGRRMMEGIFLPEQMNLNLVSSKRLENGSMALHYVKE